MRRLLILVVGVGLAHAAAGCEFAHDYKSRCIAGKCDCMPLIQPCSMYGLYPAVAHGPGTPATAVEVSADPAPAKAPVTKERLELPKE